MIERDVRVVNMRPSSVLGRDGRRRSLGDPMFAPFWKKMNDHGITLAMHSGDAGYSFLADYWGVNAEFEAFRQNAFKTLLTHSPISDALASLIAEGVLSEHRNLRVCTIETGSEWVQPLLKKFEKTYKMQRHAFAEDPIEVFARQVWVSPYYEDDLHDLKAKVGADHMLFGSDWPHAEGLRNPVDFVADLDGFDSAEVEQIMRTNGLALAARAV
jgi:predicted TIM-barrel fold metal-dependent hydrolase